MDWIRLAIGLLVLVGGADVLVRGASRLARRFGVSPLVVGLTIVAFGTSSPEVVVSLSAVYSESPSLAMGNAIGSNTFNVLFILGVSALIRPLIVQQKLVRVDVPIMIGVSVLLWLLLADGSLGRFDGALLFAGIIAYTYLAIRISRRESALVRQEYEAGVPGTKRDGVAMPSILIAVGLGLAVFGARLFVGGAVAIATDLGISPLVIGLTIVAAGTSLPEVATSIVAAIRGQRDIAVGNVIGSNIFNVLGILGLSGLLSPVAVSVPPSLLAFDLPVMVAVAVACLPILFTKHEIRRWEGGLFFASYGLYVAYLVLSTGDHAWLPGFSSFAVWFALPLAFLGIAFSAVHALLRRRGRM